MRTQLKSLNGTPASRLAFGTMQFGGTADKAASAAMFEACVDAGITHFDTAHVYTDGQSETLLGRFLGARREDLIIATKAGYNDGGSRAAIMASVETSRKRLQLETLDVLYLHRFDPDTDLHETFEAFAELKTHGYVRHFGLSNFAAWQVVKAAQIADKFDLNIDVIQPMYSLVKRQAEVEILPMAKDLGILAAPYSPLGGGLLTGKYTSGETGRLTTDSRYAARYGVAQMHQTADALGALATKLNTPAPTLAVAWAAAHECAPTPIISARSTAQLEPSLAALHFDMDADLYTAISALSPAPPPATDRIEEQA